VQILKSSVFLFINAFASFYFLAFIASSLPSPPNSAPNVTGQCAYHSCMTTLEINLVIIVGTRVFAVALLRLITTYLSTCWAERKKRLFIQVHGIISEAEVEFHKPSIDQFQYFQTQYAELAVLFGHVIYFSAALPILVICVLFLIHFGTYFCSISGSVQLLVIGVVLLLFQIFDLIYSISCTASRDQI
jgi:hypothetical protein